MSGTNVSREEIELLRASASSLIEDTGEPCWGLAQGLSELAEKMVIESGQAPATFGNGVSLSEGAAWLGGFMPECCPACGWWEGNHAAWCIHAHEDQAEQPEPTEPAASGQPVHYFGCCPVCHKEPMHLSVWRDNWCACREHRIAWYIGYGLFSAGDDMPAAWHEDNSDYLKGCKILEHQPECTCSSEPSDQEPEPGADLEGLLTWLDLSGLPPEPPAEPPARKPTNWHFDAPDGGQVQGPEDYPF